jgi:hypothetical protein
VPEKPFYQLALHADGSSKHPPGLLSVLGAEGAPAGNDK